MTDKQSVAINLFLPPKELSPNARCHFMAKARAVKKYRYAAMCAALAASYNVYGKPHWTRARSQAVFTFKDRRHRDADNLLASLKAAFDGIADSGLLANDRGLAHEPVEQARGDMPGVTITITREE